jgi:hypothetical protein
MKRWALLAALALVCAGVRAAPLAEARQAVAAAESLIAEGKLTQAERRLHRAEGRCGDDRACTALVAFGRGYLYERWAADRDASTRRVLLERAARSYRHAASLLPDNAQVLANLAIVERELGNVEAAAAAMTRAIRADPDTAYRGRVFLGDLYAENDRAESAARAYGAAMRQDPARERAPRRLLALYRRHPPAEPGVAVKLGDQWRESHPALAVQAYALALAQEGAAAEQALVRWTALQADRGGLTPKAVAALPAQGPEGGAAIEELRRLAADPLAALERGTPWWTGRPERRDALARIYRAAANRARAAGDRAAAVRLLDAAVTRAPEYADYQRPPLQRSSNARLDAAVDLLVLYRALNREQAAGELARDLEARVERLTEILFSGKGAAYGRDDLPSILRYHTALGLIYSEQGRYTSEWADNAIFQLSRALEVADRLAARDPASREPLPEIADRLARAYEETGRPRQAAQTALRAARDYLDADKPRAALQSIEQAQRTGAPAAEVRALNAVQAARTKGAAADADLDDWDGLPLPQDFLRRQRFKVLADRAGAAVERGDRRGAARAAAAALEELPERGALSGPGDIRRVRTAADAVAQAVDLGKEPEQLVRRSGTRLEVQVDEDLATAARILNLQEARPMLESPEADLKVRDGRVLLKGVDPAQPISPDLSRDLLQLQGVRKVEISPGR